MLSQYTFNMPFHVLGYYKPLLLLLSKSYKLKFLKGCVLGTLPCACVDALRAKPRRNKDVVNTHSCISQSIKVLYRGNRL